MSADDGPQASRGNGLETLYAKLLGPLNAPYYLAYFERAHHRNYAPLSWHWPAFFLGFLWLLYRKQYQWACIAFFFPYLAAVLSAAPALVGIKGIALETFFALIIAFRAVWLPLHANGIYYKWARRRVAAVGEKLPGRRAEQLEALERLGGTHRVAPWALGTALLALSAATMLAPP